MFSKFGSFQHKWVCLVIILAYAVFNGVGEGFVTRREDSYVSLPRICHWVTRKWHKNHSPSLNDVTTSSISVRYEVMTRHMSELMSRGVKVVCSQQSLADAQFPLSPPPLSPPPCSPTPPSPTPSCPTPPSPIHASPSHLHWLEECVTGVVQLNTTGGKSVNASSAQLRWSLILEELAYTLHHSKLNLPLDFSPNLHIATEHHQEITSKLTHPSQPVYADPAQNCSTRLANSSQRNSARSPTCFSSSSTIVSLEYLTQKASLRSACDAPFIFRCLIQYSTPSDQLTHPGLKVVLKSSRSGELKRTRL
ncbi:hypothetical protein F511_23202 [Dorcoceras hygrometricum]|uniref:Uncharacterized protein n=1 Tax=Dorcoceras hygrometricum TaxID=472368 RepID=A0A2Z7AFK6_9LAMI|nr:hypothetical protein F511_23202 [Dorcoceras hygrometricum]